MESKYGLLFFTTLLFLTVYTITFYPNMTLNENIFRTMCGLVAIDLSFMLLFKAIKEF